MGRILQRGNDHVIHMVTEAVAYEDESINTINGHGLGRESPLILIDSGASRSVCGRQWAEWWFGTPKLNLAGSQKQFRFGAGPTLNSLGATVIFIHAQASAANKDVPISLPIKVDVVNSNVPMLISHESLKRVKGPIAFASCALVIPWVAEIKLTNTRSGHLMIQGTLPTNEVRKMLSQENHPIYVMELKLPVIVLAEEEIRKIHAQLGHCSGNTMETTILAAQMHVDSPAIQKVVRECGRQNALQRITPPQVASRLAKYNGEIVALDIAFPFTDCFEGEIAKDCAVLFTVGSLSRFINCTLLIARASIHAGQVFMNDWARTIGNTRRIITDRGGPALPGSTWADSSRTFWRQMNRAPQFPPRQNGLGGRTARSLEIAANRIISATRDKCPVQEIFTQAAIAKNHAPRDVTGAPPALAMAGRCDIFPVVVARRSCVALNRLIHY